MRKYLQPIVFLLFSTIAISSCMIDELGSKGLEKSFVDNSVNELASTSSYFYYYNSEKQYLELDTKHIFISVQEENINSFSNSDISQSFFQADISGNKRFKTNHKRFWTVLNLETDMTHESYLAKLSEIKNTEKNIIVAPYFKNHHQDKIGLSNFFYVKLKESNDIELLERFAEKSDAVVVSQNEFMPLWFVLSVTENSKYNALEMANYFYESGLFEFAEPDLLVDDNIYSTNDIYFDLQWGLANTIILPIFKQHSSYI